MAAKADTLGRDIRQATRDIMAGKKNLPEVKVCTCTQYQPFLAILLIFCMELKATNLDVIIQNRQLSTFT